MKPRKMWPTGQAHHQIVMLFRKNMCAFDCSVFIIVFEKQHALQFIFSIGTDLSDGHGPRVINKTRSINTYFYHLN